MSHFLADAMVSKAVAMVTKAVAMVTNAVAMAPNAVAIATMKASASEALIGYQFLQLYPHLNQSHLQLSDSSSMLERLSTTSWHGCRAPKVIPVESRKCH